MIAEAVCEAYVQHDWGGEADDLFSTQVILGGRRVWASLLLKGSGLAVSLKQKSLGRGERGSNHAHG